MRLTQRLFYTLCLLTLAGLLSCENLPAASPQSGAETAQEWNKGLVGWNLGNQLECSAPGMDGESMAIGNPPDALGAETAWGNPKVTRNLLKAVKDAGFNAVRVPVRWQCHITNAQAMTVDKDWMARVKEIVGWCLDLDMKVILNTHHEKWLEGRPFYANKEENCRLLALLWFNLANEFRDYDGRLAFAGTNEVHVKDNWGKPTEENLAVQNAYNQTFIDMVRATGGNNLRRNLIVQTYVCNPDFGLYNGDFIIPMDVEENGTRHMSVEFHYYTPWEYAGEGKCEFWGEAYSQYGPVPESNERTMETFLDRVEQTWASRGLGVVIGEWGVSDHYSSANMDRARENATYYTKMLVGGALRRGFSTFVWDNNSFGNGSEKFGIFDRWKGNKIRAPWMVEGVRQAKENQ